MRIGIDFGGTKIEGIALDANGAEQTRIRVPTRRGDYAASCEQVRDLVARLSRAAGAPASRVGIGIPGAPSPQTGLIKNANSTWLIGHDFRGDIEAALDLPVAIANDANCLALSEAVDGAGTGHRLVFAAILGSGVGAGIAVEGRIHAGPNAIAGEWGHNPLPWPADNERPGPACYCGKSGCIETWLSGPGLARRHQDDTGETLDPQQIVSNMRSGDAGAKETFGLYVDRLSRALAGVINILDPDVVVLGGGLSNINELYTLIGDNLGAYVFSDTCVTPVLKAAHGDASGVRGAAWL